MLNLKLFLWEDILQDWTPGVAFAIAPDEETARTMILDKAMADGYDISWDLGKPPKVIEDLFAFYLWG